MSGNILAVSTSTAPYIESYSRVLFSRDGIWNLLLLRVSRIGCRRIFQPICNCFSRTRQHVSQITPEPETLANLERFLPFNQEANTRVSDKQDALFSSLGRWLIKSMKKNMSPADLEWVSLSMERFPNHQKLNLCGFQDGSIHQAKVILREVMRMLVAYENLTRSILNPDEKYGHGREFEEEESDPPFIPSGQKTFAIILGVYQMEQIHFDHEDGSALKVASQIGRLPDGCSLGPVPEKAVDIFALQEYLYSLSGGINHIDGAEAAPPRVQLFTFLLRRFFNLQFQQGYLWTADKYEDYLEFLSDGHIFTNHLASDGTGILADISNPPVYSFRRM